MRQVARLAAGLLGSGALLGCAYPRDAEPEVAVAEVSTTAEASALRERHADADGRFFNPGAEDPKTVWGMLRWQLFTRNPYRKLKPGFYGTTNQPVRAKFPRAPDRVIRHIGRR